MSENETPKLSATDELEKLMSEVSQLMNRARELMPALTAEHTARIQDFVLAPNQQKMDDINDIAGLLEVFAIRDNALDDDDMFERYNGVHFDYIDVGDDKLSRVLKDTFVETETAYDTWEGNEDHAVKEADIVAKLEGDDDNTILGLPIEDLQLDDEDEG
jgi:hypothetical protein